MTDTGFVIDAHATPVENWLLSDHPQTRSAPIMKATAQILRELADLAEANARLAKRRQERRDYNKAYRERYGKEFYEERE